MKVVKMCADESQTSQSFLVKRERRHSNSSRVFVSLQQLHTLEKDLVSACDLLGVGAEYARVVGSEYTRWLSEHHMHLRRGCLISATCNWLNFVLTERSSCWAKAWWVSVFTRSTVHQQILAWMAFLVMWPVWKCCWITLWVCSCCWWSVSCRRFIRSWRCAGRSWKPGRETQSRRSPCVFSSWCCRWRITWMPDRWVSFPPTFTAQTFLSDTNRIDFELYFTDKCTDSVPERTEADKMGLFEPTNKFWSFIAAGHQVQFPVQK